jgi:hypothetical protein
MERAVKLIDAALLLTGMYFGFGDKVSTIGSNYVTELGTHYSTLCTDNPFATTQTTSSSSSPSIF